MTSKLQIWKYFGRTLNRLQLWQWHNSRVGNNYWTYVPMGQSTVRYSGARGLWHMYHISMSTYPHVVGLQCLQVLDTCFFRKWNSAYKWIYKKYALQMLNSYRWQAPSQIQLTFQRGAEELFSNHDIRSDSVQRVLSLSIVTLSTYSLAMQR